MQKYGYLNVFIAGVLWGSVGLFIDILNGMGVGVELIGFLRTAFSFLIMFSITAFKYGIRTFKVSHRTLILCILLGVLCHGVYNIFYNLSVIKIGVSLSAVLLNIAPVFTAVTSMIVFGEKMNRFKVFALIINVIGCTLVATGGNFDVAAISVLGIMCGVGAGFCYSLTSVIGRLSSDDSNPFVASTYSYLFAAIFFAAALKPWHGLPSVNSEIMITGFLYALIPTSIAYLLYYIGSTMITETSKVPIISSVESVVAILIGVMLLNEHMNVTNVIGILLTFTSIILIQMKKR